MKQLLIALCAVWAGTAAAQVISASTLVQEYARDGYAAQSKYAGKIITVSGTIETLDTSSHGTPRITLASVVVLSLADDQTNNLDLLHSGELITANCAVGEGPQLPELTACELSEYIDRHRAAHQVY